MSYVLYLTIIYNIQFGQIDRYVTVRRSLIVFCVVVTYFFFCVTFVLWIKIAGERYLYTVLLFHLILVLKN
jgi:hypothetical protein